MVHQHIQPGSKGRGTVQPGWEDLSLGEFFKFLILYVAFCHLKSFRSHIYNHKWRQYSVIRHFSSYTFLRLIFRGWPGNSILKCSKWFWCSKASINLWIQKAGMFEYLWWLQRRFLDKEPKLSWINLPALKKPILTEIYWYTLFTHCVNSIIWDHGK